MSYRIFPCRKVICRFGLLWTEKWVTVSINIHHGIYGSHRGSLFPKKLRFILQKLKFLCRNIFEKETVSTEPTVDHFSENDLVVLGKNWASVAFIASAGICHNLISRYGQHLVHVLPCTNALGFLYKHVILGMRIFAKRWYLHTKSECILYPVGASI